MVTVYDYPRFSRKLEKLEVRINKVLKFSLPVIQEFEPITVSHTSLPSFSTFNYLLYTFSPNDNNYIGQYFIIGTIGNYYLSKNFRFTVNVFNDPPFFISELDREIIAVQNSVLEYRLPAIEDKEGHNVSITCYGRDGS
jgi:hypothetical protein